MATKRGAGKQMAMGTVTTGYHVNLKTGEWAAMGPKGEKHGTAKTADAARKAAKKALTELGGDDK